MNKIIGIISYLPNNEIIRKNRLLKLDSLIAKCNSLFKLPIIIIAQNYLDSDIWFYKNKYSNIVIYDYVDKLGITGARKELRQKFLESSYDYLIMLDDDCELKGSSGEGYLKQIDNNPGCFIEFKKTLLKLFAISKELFNKVDYENINPENEEGFEDRIFVNKLRILYPDKKRVFLDTGVYEYSISTKDKYSTWYKNQNLKEMIDKTELINKSFYLK